MVELGNDSRKVIIALTSFLESNFLSLKMIERQIMGQLANLKANFINTKSEAKGVTLTFCL